MPLSKMFGAELLDEYRKGKREFSDIRMQFADLSSENLEGIIIRDSKLHFALFRVAKLKGCKFINCEIFFGGFRDADLANTIFEDCKLDYCYFENSVFNNTQMIRCRLSWCGLFSPHINCLDASSSELFKVFTDPSQLTQEDMNAGYSGLMPLIGCLDPEIRNQVKPLLQSVIRKVGIEPNVPAVQPAYGKSAAGIAYQQLGNLIEKAVHAYAIKEPYKPKHTYSKPDTQYKEIGSERKRE